MLSASSLRRRSVATTSGVIPSADGPCLEDVLHRKSGIVDFAYLSGRLGRGRAGARVPRLLATRVVA
jgi:hypothetical protein